MKLESINFWFIALLVSVSHSVCPIMDLGKRCRLNRPLNLSSEQRKVSLEHLSNTNFFWSENSGLLGIKSFHGRVDSSSWYTRSWAYIVLPRIEPHWQLPSLLVHWSYRERNIQEMLYKYGGVRRQKHGKSGLPNCTYRQNRSLL